jgi:hypothetical protein
MAEISKTRTISYANKDFDGFKRDLMRFAKAHLSGSFENFNESSPGMALLELNAYVGDVLAYYIDDSFNELRQQTARRLENVVANAKAKGYVPTGRVPARGLVHVAVELPATTVNGQLIPDDSYTPSLMKGSAFTSQNGVVYETVTDMHFSATIDRQITGSRFSSTTGLPTHFAVRKPVEVIAGETTTDSFTIGEFQRFRSVELSYSDVIEVIDVFDSDGNEWHQVDYLAQDWVFVDSDNTGDDADAVPYVMKLEATPRRFVVDRDVVTGKSTLIFGSGDGTDYDDVLVPNAADMALPFAGRSAFSPPSIDPRNFVATSTMGLGPYSTTLTVRYRVGGGSETNAAPRMIKNVSRADLSFATTGLNATTKGAVESSIACVNLTAIDGGREAETVQEIKNNSSAFFAAQSRAVTVEDYIARVMSIPQRYGKPARASVRPGFDGAIEVRVVAQDSDDAFSRATSTLKKNIATYLKKFRMMTDRVRVMDANVINLKCSFGVVISSKEDRNEVLLNCINTLSDLLDTSRMQVGQPIIVSELASAVQSVKGVISVYEMMLTPLLGGQYSRTSFDASAWLRDEILHCPPDAVFEVKFPKKDIVGSGK